MRGTADKLIYMANQIARNLATCPDPAAATADHIATFWEPGMKARLLELEGEAQASFDPVALAAIHRLGQARD